VILSTMQLAFTAGSAVCAAVVAQKDKVLSFHSETVCAAASAVSGAVKDPKGAMIAAKEAVSSAVVAQKDRVLALPIVSNHSEAVCAAASAVSGAVKDPKGAMNAVQQHVVVQRVVNDPFGSISDASRASIVFVSNVSATAYIATMQKLQARRQQLAGDFPSTAAHLAAAQHRVITVAAPVIQSIRSYVAPAPVDEKSESSGLASASKIDLAAVRSKVSSVVEKANAVRSYYTAAAVSQGHGYASAVAGSAISVAQSIIRTIDSADVVVDGLLAMVAQKVIDDRELLAEYVHAVARLMLLIFVFDTISPRLCKLRSDELQDSLALGQKVEPGSATNRLTEQFATVIGRVSARLNRRADALARSMRRAAGHTKAAKSPASPQQSPVPLDNEANPLYSPFFDSAAPSAVSLE
jgi:hypothetical protein